MKLNLGCGLSKFEGYVNIDVDPELKPDQVMDFTKGIDFPTGSVEQVVLYHTLEHIQKFKWDNLFREVWRILGEGGTFILTFPEFRVCSQYWLENKRGKRQFWEATLYGRQSSSSDYHVALCDRTFVARQLMEHGFEILTCDVEPAEDHNSIIVAKKAANSSYEDILVASVWGGKVE